AGNNMTFFIGLYKLHRSITLPCRSFSDALALGVKGFAAWFEMYLIRMTCKTFFFCFIKMRCPHGGDRPELAETGNIDIKGDASNHTPGACAASVAILGLSSGRTLMFHESCGGVYYPGILRGRILARLRIKRTKRLNKTRRLKLRILMLDSTGLACASRACKGCNGLSGGSPCRSPCCLLASSQDCTLTFGGTFSMFVLVPGDNLVDSWYRSRSLGLFYCNLSPEVSHNQCWDNLALCSHGIQRILGMLSQNLKVERYILLKPIGSGTFSSKNSEAGWTVVKESVGCVDLQGDLLVYPFDSKSSSPGRLLLLFGAVPSFASSSYPLGRLKDGTICVKLVNP
ncbi:LOW QUALITY PROTEIN: hypothetical protein HID58_086994, partial [Brassica napus]